MKSVVLAFVILFFCSVVAANELSTIEQKQRFLVFRYYEILEVFPERCPEGIKKEFLSSVDRFKRVYYEFNSLIKNSRFRIFAINNSSNYDLINKEICLYYKAMIDDLNTEKGKVSIDKYLLIMRSNA